MVVFEENSLNEKLKEFPHWELKNNAIERNFLFKNFSEAIAFIMRLAIESEKINHHAEIWNVYNKVNIRLNTHSANAITSLDFGLAKKIDSLVE